VAQEQRQRGTVLVASGDRDTFQLASERTIIMYPVQAGELARIGPAEVRERYGVDPEQVPYFIALRGDPSDKLPGARGVGSKGAADLLRRYGTLDGILAAGRFATPLPSLDSQTPTWAKAAAVVRKWGLNQLADRLIKIAKTRPTGS
jgi:DNA polymerase-1